MPSRIAVIAAHPDDEVLGFGGTIARHAAAGDIVHICVLATGLAARGPINGQELDRLRDCGRQAAAILGAAAIEFGDFPDNQMDTVPLLQAVSVVERFLATHRPSRVYTHHIGDLNIDHQIVHRAVVTACRPVPKAVVREILVGEVASSTEWSGVSPPFTPTEYMDIEHTLDLKLRALEAYDTEMRPFPHARSREAVRSRALVRGAEAGLRAAEAFMTYRRLA